MPGSRRRAGCSRLNPAHRSGDRHSGQAGAGAAHPDPEYGPKEVIHQRKWLHRMPARALMPEEHTLSKNAKPISAKLGSWLLKGLPPFFTKGVGLFSTLRMPSASSSLTIKDRPGHSGGIDPLGSTTSIRPRMPCLSCSVARGMSFGRSHSSTLICSFLRLDTASWIILIP